MDWPLGDYERAIALAVLYTGVFGSAAEKLFSTREELVPARLGQAR
jgi:hypothetical protein